MRLQKMIDHQTVDRPVITANLLVRIIHRASPGQLQPIQCALAGQRFSAVLLDATVFSFHIFFTNHYGHCRIAPQLIMIVQIFISQIDSIHALPHQFLNREFYESRISVVPETRRKPPDDSRPLLGLAQQQTASIAGDVATVKMPDHFAIS